ncbi:hypothetical protein AS026_15790 [Rhizobium altiplani]|uniref:Uncharacterized protein n=1 Tax=Rhizobium altiplani TaxID=1864509 RepID=A0A120FHA8_9HYPH|nr:hypothetical protein [Rhizobium altiplani]KWV45666.1 hypothetical protein AS026_15790 [Rhizobium altiplani]
MADYITYRNQGATRNQPLDDDLAKRLAYLQKMGVTMEVFSGGQPTKEEGGPRTGSVRHDHGGAADAFFYKDGRKLDWANQSDRPIFEQIVSQGKANGITGFGAGPGYMQPGSMHIGGGTPGVWGADGKSANAPEWLSKAYGGAPSSMMAQVQSKQIDPIAEVVAAAGNTAPQAVAGSSGTPSATVAASDVPATPPATADASKGLLGIEIPKGLPAMLQFSALAMNQQQPQDDTPRGGLLQSQPVQVQQLSMGQAKTYKPWEQYLGLLGGRLA